MTNLEKIRQMEEEDLAAFLCNLMCAECCERTCPAREFCKVRDSGMTHWLRKDADDEQR